MAGWTEASLDHPIRAMTHLSVACRQHRTPKAAPAAADRDHSRPVSAALPTCHVTMAMAMAAPWSPSHVAPVRPSLHQPPVVSRALLARLLVPLLPTRLHPGAPGLPASRHPDAYHVRAVQPAKRVATRPARLRVRGGSAPAVAACVPATGTSPSATRSQQPSSAPDQDSRAAPVRARRRPAPARYRTRDRACAARPRAEACSPPATERPSTGHLSNSLPVP